MREIKYVRLPKWIWDRRTWVMYLIIPDITNLSETVRIAPEERFYELVNQLPGGLYQPKENAPW